MEEYESIEIRSDFYFEKRRTENEKIEVSVEKFLQQVEEFK